MLVSIGHAEAPPPALDPDAVQKMLELIRTTPPADFRGMVVMKDGKVVLEEYFNIGIAIDEGLVKSVDQSVRDFLPRPAGQPAGEDRFARITIANLLTMASGLDADDGDDKSPGNAEKWMSRDDWVAFAMTLPSRYPPGTKWVYSDVCPMLVGAIIEKQSGMKLADFARRNLFEPLGIREYYWYTGRGGSTGAAGNLYITTHNVFGLILKALRPGADSH